MQSIKERQAARCWAACLLRMFCLLLKGMWKEQLFRFFRSCLRLQKIYGALRVIRGISQQGGF